MKAGSYACRDEGASPAYEDLRRTQLALQYNVPSAHRVATEEGSCNCFSGGTGYHNSVVRDVMGSHLPSVGVVLGSTGEGQGARQPTGYWKPKHPSVIVLPEQGEQGVQMWVLASLSGCCCVEKGLVGASLEAIVGSSKEVMVVCLAAEAVEREERRWI